MTDHYHYPGEELQLFAEAGSWKRYFAGKISGFIKGDVLEVGAGMGETTSYLLNEKVSSWTCLEPDENLLALIKEKIQKGILPALCRSEKGSIRHLDAEKKFDTILYIDVLEHIKDDRAELNAALPHLRTGGHLVILSPAFPFLFSRFDHAIGHERRYTKKTLREAADDARLLEKKMFYLESAGALLLFLNKHLKKDKYPSPGAIRIWQKFFIPVSKLADKIIFYTFGKTLIGIWQKQEKQQ